MLNCWLENGNQEKKGLASLKNKGLAIDEITNEWLCRAKANKIPISGPLIQEKASKIAKEKGFVYFKASYGWFEEFWKWHKIFYKNGPGEAGLVNMREAVSYTHLDVYKRQDARTPRRMSEKG